MIIPSRSISSAASVIAVSLLCGCERAYYGAWEAVGVEKRDILVDRVEDARDEQAKAKEQFASALERFMAVVNVEGGELEKQYSKLKGELKASESRATAVRERIDEVENVSEDLFREWEKELAGYSSTDLRRRSEEQLRATRRRYEQMHAAMERAESKMEPVLAVFRDQVLFLKHNLNARAVSGLEGVARELDSDVANLIRDMEASIDEANAFIEGMGSEEK